MNTNSKPEHHTAEMCLILLQANGTEWGSRERIQKKPKQSSAYIRLLTASERFLKSVIEHNEGGTNKDLGKFADQIIALVTSGKGNNARDKT